PRVVAAIEDRTITLPRAADIMADLRCLRSSTGIIRVSDGQRGPVSARRARHGHSAISLAMLQYAVPELEPAPTESQSTGLRRAARRRRHARCRLRRRARPHTSRRILMGYVQRHSGLVVPESFAEPSERPAQPEMREVATTGGGRDITRGYVDPMMLLRPQDSVLRLRGNGNYELYREVLRDDQVQACFAQRRLAVVSREWEVVPGGDTPADEEAAEFLREQLRR